MYTQAQINLQKQDQQLGFDILGRLFCAAENYYLKCKGESYNYHSAKYSSHDIFHNANKKSKDVVRRELINQINIFQSSNQYYMSKYQHGLQPPNLQDALEDLKLWKKSMKSQKDIELYDSIFKVLNNCQVNTDNFSNENPNQEYNKAGKQEFWSNMGTYSSAATQKRIEEINNNPNFQPTLNRGNPDNLYGNSNPSFYAEKAELSHNANKIIDNLLYQFDQYYKGNKNVIIDIKQNYNKLAELIKKLEAKSAFIFPESIISKKDFIYNLDLLINSEKKKENKIIFNNLKELFVESFL